MITHLHRDILTRVGTYLHPPAVAAFGSTCRAARERHDCMFDAYELTLKAGWGRIIGEVVSHPLPRGSLGEALLEPLGELDPGAEAHPAPLLDAFKDFRAAARIARQTMPDCPEVFRRPLHDKEAARAWRVAQIEQEVPECLRLAVRTLKHRADVQMLPVPLFAPTQPTGDTSWLSSQVELKPVQVICDVDAALALQVSMQRTVFGHNETTKRIDLICYTTPRGDDTSWQLRDLASPRIFEVPKGFTSHADEGLAIARHLGYLLCGVGGCYPMRYEPQDADRDFDLASLPKATQFATGGLHIFQLAKP